MKNLNHVDLATVVVKLAIIRNANFALKRLDVLTSERFACI